MDSGEFYGILNARLEAWFKREADPAQPMMRASSSR
jgi:hypothetical protein